jgi:tetratricopeptide (TPR) repeat protein/glycosyltransferase involved in cell wall biosynthesis
MTPSPKPLFSVVIPVYNGEKYLTSAMQSVFNLKAEALELIVVDDGSTDATADILSSFVDRVRYVVQPNRGPAAARNRGLQCARGEVIGFLDADDLWTPNILTRAFAFLLAHPEVDIVQGHIQEIKSSAADATGIAYEYFSQPYSYINIGSAVYRKDVFAKVGGFDETMRFCEDYDWFLRAFAARIPKVCIPEVTLLYRTHSDGMTYGKSLHEIGMVKAHKKIIEQRRHDPRATSKPPANFPSLLEYIGSRRQFLPPPNGTANTRRTAAAARTDEAAQSGTGRSGTPLDQVLTRRDDKAVATQPGDILCFMCVRNESSRLPYCLAYHRSLGISRFFVVDNDSTDDTLPWLLDQPDVHVWQTDGSFRAARCGTDWLELLLREYGVNHWCLIVDADELLWYVDCETRRLEALCADLDQKGKRALFAVLLDMYSDKPIRETQYQRGQDFLAVCPYFDRQFYHSKTDNFFGHNEHSSYFGGLRQRVFAGKEPGQNENYFYCLNKVPLLKYDRSFVLSDNLHWTNCRDVADETGCLLHFKYFSSFLNQVREEVERKEHWNEAIQYRQYANAINANPHLRLFAEEHSVQFRGSQQLVEFGIIRKDQRQTTEMGANVPGTVSDDNSPVDNPGVQPEMQKPAHTQALVRQVRDLIRSHKRHGDHPHETGIALLKQGNLEGAAAAFRRALELNPHFSWSYHNLGDVLTLQKKWEEALAAFRRAIELNPHFALSHSNLGDLLVKQEKWEEAIAAYRMALQLQPDLAMTAKSLARALVRLAQSHVEEAKRWYQRTHELNPDDPEIYHEAMALRPTDPDLCIQLADALVTRNQATKAIFFYQLALQVRPDDAAVLIKLAKVLRMEKEPEQAIACCRRATTLDTNQGQYHRLLGDLLADQGQFEEATEAYQRAGEREATSAEIHKRLGDLFARQGRIDEASAAYERAIELGYKSY